MGKKMERSTFHCHGGYKIEVQFYKDKLTVIYNTNFNKEGTINFLTKYIKGLSKKTALKLYNEFKKIEKFKSLQY